MPNSVTTCNIRALKRKWALHPPARISHQQIHFFLKRIRKASHSFPLTHHSHTSFFSLNKTSSPLSCLFAAKFCSLQKFLLSKFFLYKWYLFLYGFFLMKVSIFTNEHIHFFLSKLFFYKKYLFSMIFFSIMKVSIFLNEHICFLLSKFFFFY